MPSRRASSDTAARIASSSTATPAPRLARAALRARVSPRAFGTRSPGAIVAGFFQGSEPSLPSLNAFTIGAHPSAWTNAIFGIGPSCHPRSRSSWNAFHSPTTAVPPPVGKTTQSGSPPSCSNSSYPIVFFPSTRYGSYIVATLKWPASLQTAFTMSAAWALVPSTRNRRAPNRTVSWRIDRGVSFGATTRASIPAFAAYAASALPAFPALGTARRVSPSSFAIETATAIPRALKVPVGFAASSFTNTRLIPYVLSIAGARSNGVPPSPRVSARSSEETGNTGRYRHRSRLGRRESRLTSVKSYRATSGLSQSHTFQGADGSYSLWQGGHSRRGAVAQRGGDALH